MASSFPPTSLSSTPPQGPASQAAQMSSDQIKEMMAQAQRMIEERKRSLAMASGQAQQAHHGHTLLPAPRTMHPVIQPTPPPQPERLQDEEPDAKKRKLAELQAKIEQKLLASGVNLNEEEEKETKPVPLLLDNEGRVIDMFGKELSFQHHQPTLKANIRAQKRGSEFKIPIPVASKSSTSSTAIKSEPTPSSSSSGSGKSSGVATDSRSKGKNTNIYFDNRIGPVKARPKKALKFNEPGKYIGLANKQRIQAQLAKLQSEIADKARKTGISTAARLARLSGAVGLATADDKGKEYIPQVEWWDSLLLGEKDEEGNKINREILSYDQVHRKGAVSNLIEHPIQAKPPTDPLTPVFMPVFLTKKEKKKLRRQNRREAWKDKQEKIRLGLEAAPAAKVRISNLMRVLGVEAVQDPTKIEQHVKSQMAKRLKTHLDSNAARKLTPEQRREKKIRKTKEDLSLGVHVAVYRVDDLRKPGKKFKVETNARQLLMTGTILVYRECNVIVVEGGPKQQKKYKKLMLSRIKWDEDLVQEGAEEKPNKCVLVWEGQTKERSFPDLKYKMVQNEGQAREHFKKHGVQHYWDYALSGNVLESADIE